jgi:hypothetical protein
VHTHTHTKYNCQKQQSEGDDPESDPSRPLDLARQHALKFAPAEPVSSLHPLVLSAVSAKYRAVRTEWTAEAEGRAVRIMLRKEADKNRALREKVLCSRIFILFLKHKFLQQRSQPWILQCALTASTRDRNHDF